MTRLPAGEHAAPAPSVLIASYLEVEEVRRIEAAHPEVRVHYRPDLVPRPRYPSDHVGEPLTRTAAERSEWHRLLRQADILFDFDWTNLEALPELAPQLRWLQSSGSGIGPMINRLGYRTRLPDMQITRASGIHAQPLSEFCLMVMLMHARNHRTMVAQQHAMHWERFSGTDLAGRTVVIVGLGGIGQELVRMCHALGLRVVGIGRTTDAARYAELPLDRYLAVERLAEVLPTAEYLVLVVPHTSETENLLTRARIAALPQGAVLINIGRGALVDEPALLDALREGHVACAGLDVFREEPLPAGHPFWTMPNVLVSPHSAGTSDRENHRLTDLFIENLGNFLARTPMRNLLE